MLGILPHGRCVYSLPLIYLFNNLYQDELMDIYFMIWVIIQCYIIYFAVQIVPALGALSVVSCVSLTSSHNCGVFLCLFLCFLSTFFLSGTKRCSKIIFYISCPSPRISYFLRSPPNVCFICSFAIVYKVFWSPLCLALDIHCLSLFSCQHH